MYANEIIIIRLLLAWNFLSISHYRKPSQIMDLNLSFSRKEKMFILHHMDTLLKYLQ